MRKKLEKHIKENIREYLIFAIILIIGIFLGTAFLNNSNETQVNEISEYINNFTSQIKDGKAIDYSKLIFEILIKDAKLILLIAFLSVSIIGVPALYLIIGYKGFCIGYTISAISTTLGIGKGLLFSISLSFFNKIIEIPTIFYLILSGIKMYKTIIKDRSKENIKYAITRYFLSILISIALLFISAFIETYLSSNLFLTIIKFI